MKPALLLPGDWLILVCGCVFVASLVAVFWRGPQGDTLIIRAGGKVYDQVSLQRARTVRVTGPLGITLIEIQPGRARIARDPSPRQLCVKQGWLSRAGEAALCLPNQVSVEIRGKTRAFDSIAY